VPNDHPQLPPASDCSVELGATILRRTEILEMTRYLATFLLTAFAVTGCGEPVRGVDEDAKAAKAQAHEAVSAAEQAARRIDELSRAPVDEATRPH